MLEDTQIIEYNEQLWAKVDHDMVTIGISQEVFDDVNEIWGVDLPSEGTEVNPEEVCGEVETDDGPINLYSPIEGEVIDVNHAVESDYELLFDDSTEEGWLIRVKSLNIEDLKSFLSENDKDTEI